MVFILIKRAFSGPFGRFGLGIAAVVAILAIRASLQVYSPKVDTPSMLDRLRRETPQGMVMVPGGPFIAGSSDDDADEDSRPAHTAAIPTFYIDLHEVTNSEFHEFDPTHLVPKGEGDLPANSITYNAAAAYARWAGKRLPTEAEWEKAARGTDGRRYPWGNVWDARKVAARRKRPNDLSSAPIQDSKGKRCSIGPSRLQAIGSIGAGASPYGCVDMAGNAWEWVQGFYNGNPQQRILRGGAVGYGERACRAYARAIEGAGDT